MKKIWPSGYCWLRTQNLELLISVLQLPSYSPVRPVCISVPSPTLKIWGMRMLPFLTSKNLLRRDGQGDLLGIHRHAFWFKQASLLSPQSNYCVCLDRASECAWDRVPALKSALCILGMPLLIDMNGRNPFWQHIHYFLICTRKWGYEKLRLIRRRSHENICTKGLHNCSCWVF